MLKRQKRLNTTRVENKDMGVDVAFCVVDDNWTEIDYISGVRAANYEWLEDISVFTQEERIIKDKEGHSLGIDMYRNDNKFMYTTKALLLKVGSKDFTRKQLKEFAKYPDTQKIVVCWC